MITLDELNLPPDLWWSDETDWTPVWQHAAFSLDGALVVEESMKRAGRPITLSGDTQRAWVRRETVLALGAMAAEAGKLMHLHIHGREFAVMFRHDKGPPVEAFSLRGLSPPEAGDAYVLTLRLMVVDEKS